MYVCLLAYDYNLPTVFPSSTAKRLRYPILALAQHISTLEFDGKAFTRQLGQLQASLGDSV